MALLTAAVSLLCAGGAAETAAPGVRQLTHAPHGHILVNRGCWSADGNWLLYDLRTDETVFDGRRIERVHVVTGEVQVLFQAAARTAVGVPTCAPDGDRYVFLRGPSPDSNDDWPYAAWHREGMLGRISQPNAAAVLDARDLSPPLTPGALRGGTHLHTFGPDGRRVASTYEDHLLAAAADDAAEANRRVVAVTELGRRVAVSAGHPRDQAGDWTVVVTRVHDRPTPGSDEIARAFSEAWLGSKRSNRLAFLGLVTGADGRQFSEVFLVELPDDLTRSGDGPLEGTPTTRPVPPAEVVQRRLTFTADSRHPGTAGPRHWAVGSPDGAAIGFYRKRDDGRVRFCTVSPNGGEIREVTSGEHEPTSAFTWSPDGSRVAFAADGSVFVTDAATGAMRRLTPKADPGPTFHACVWSPDGARIAYGRPVEGPEGRFDQLFVVEAPR